jgi:hypothetical protein
MPSLNEVGCYQQRLHRLTATVPINIEGATVLALLPLLIVPVAIQVLLSLGALIPYVGGFVSEIGSILAFFVFFFIGDHAGGKAKRLTRGRRAAMFVYALVACTLTFATPYAAGYYTRPVTFARTVAAEKHVTVTYEEASTSIKALLRQETGSDGVIASAIYGERVQLSAHSLGQYISGQFDDVDDLEGIVSAVVNTVLHTIPMLLKWVLCDKLGWVSEPGFIGLGFWYLVALALSCWGYVASD